jgi:hypothetical protein
MTAHSADTPAGWAVAAAELPERLDGWRVLEIGGDSGGELFRERGAAEFVSCAQPSEDPGFDGPFNLVHCSSALETDLHPLSIFAWVWMQTVPGSVLLAGMEVLTRPAHSQFARYLPAAESAAGVARWVPGRLALRWMVEVSGFDGDWLGERPGTAAEGYVQAARTERPPALDLFRQPLGR